MKKLSILLIVLVISVLIGACTDEEPEQSSGSSTAPWEQEGSYPWEDDENIPDLSFETSIPEFINNGEDGHGENGDTWELPEWNISGDVPNIDDVINIPDFPADLEEGYPEMPGQ